jgi:tetrahedral aminopeptidase
MKTEEFLRTATAMPGFTGNEGKVARMIADAFSPYCDDVRIDTMQSVIARAKGSGPRVMVCAHLDEIGLMVTRIEDDGCLRVGNAGGVDPRILPGMRVNVHERETLPGVIGAKSPHLLTKEERARNYAREDLYVDLALPADKVKALVNIGDYIALEARFTPLLNRRYATKTADDRACVAILLRAAEALMDMRHSADVYFVLSSQEEVGGYGAMTAAYAVDPDYAVTLDVCHAETPGAPQGETFRPDSMAAATGPYINAMMRSKLEAVARANQVTLQTSVYPRYTSTDADGIGTARAGIPTVLLELPVKYMHTTVETFDMHTLEEGARLLALYLAAMDDTWEDALWT